MGVDGVDVWTVALSFWFVFPAYAANAAPVLLGGGMPMDFGRNFVDQRRLLGDGKTIRGFVGGMIGGLLVGVFEAFIANYVIYEAGKLTVLSPVAIDTLQCTPLRAFLLSLGALVGDTLGSFAKRRIGLERGSPVPLLDQLTFLVGALTLVSLVFPFQLEYALVLLIATPLIHLAANAISYFLGLKRVPW
jgi:CDP-2,3-bis-(O-geranylgeranyl)-sn-glycerol synthase